MISLFGGFLGDWGCMKCTELCSLLVIQFTVSVHDCSANQNRAAVKGFDEYLIQKKAVVEPGGAAPNAAEHFQNVGSMRSPW